ncbi:hypothetical protein BDQ17DRAFT_1403215 [Cyathus striatus]|nr:hypothetical protein BDQ17DRAFT_1403215 [Cyathus striatus]
MLRTTHTKRAPTTYVLTPEQLEELKDDLEEGGKALDQSLQYLKTCGNDMPDPLLNELLEAYDRYMEKYKTIRSDYVETRCFMFLGSTYDEMRAEMTRFLQGCMATEADVKAASAKTIKNKKFSQAPQKNGNNFYATNCTLNVNANDNNGVLAGAHNLQLPRGSMLVNYGQQLSTPEGPGGDVEAFTDSPPCYVARNTPIASGSTDTASIISPLEVPNFELIEKESKIFASFATIDFYKGNPRSRVIQSSSSLASYDICPEAPYLEEEQIAEAQQKNAWTNISKWRTSRVWSILPFRGGHKTKLVPMSQRR